MLPPFLNTNSDSAATRPVRSRQLTSSVAVAGAAADGTVEVMDLRISRRAARAGYPSTAGTAVVLAPPVVSHQSPGTRRRPIAASASATVAA